MDDYFSSYLRYANAGRSEVPTVYHRWTALSIVSAMLGRQVWLPFGHSKIYPNQYVMLMGSPGTRKGTAINIGAAILRKVGYNRFAADRCSKERFLKEMKQMDASLDVDDVDLLVMDAPSEVYVVAEEFTDFTGNNNMEFITLLTKLWDNHQQYEHPKLHGPSVIVHQPTVNIYGGNTPQGFALAFPPEAIGNGFLSRTLFIYGEPTGIKVTIPPPPDELLGASVVDHLKEVRREMKGQMGFEHAAKELLDDLYKNYVDLDDHRFKHYSTRRLTHLLKIAMVIAVTDGTLKIREDHLLKANSVLNQAEIRFPRALGEYGKSKYSDVSNLVLEVLSSAKEPMAFQALWKKVSKDLNKSVELVDILKNLLTVGKIQEIKIGKIVGFLPLIETKQTWDEKYLMNDWLTMEELIA